MTNVFSEIAQKIQEHQGLTVLRTYDELQRDYVDEYNNSIGELKGYNCDICNNKGFCKAYENGEVINRICKCESQRGILKKLEQSGLSELIQKYTFKTYQTTQGWQGNIKEKAIEFLRHEDKWFFIGGQSGSGKTHICTAICGQLLKQNKNVRYMLWVSDLRKLKAVTNDKEQYEQLFSEFADADVLYIDDLFKVRSDNDLTASDIQRTYEIINHRYNRQCITIFSSEKSVNQIRDIDNATGSRIYQRSKEFTFDLGKNIDKDVRLW